MVEESCKNYGLPFCESKQQKMCTIQNFNILIIDINY